MPLPHPINGDQEYLAAILEELKTLRAALVPQVRFEDVETKPVALREPEPVPVLLKKSRR